MSPLLPREVLSVQASDLIIGVLIVLAGTYGFLTRREAARWLHEYYQRRPQRELKPRWLFHVFRPSERTTLVAVTAFVLFMIAAGAYMAVSGVL
jgi:hypothetical protein